MQSAYDGSEAIDRTPHPVAAFVQYVRVHHGGVDGLLYQGFVKMMELSESLIPHYVREGPEQTRHIICRLMDAVKSYLGSISPLHSVGSHTSATRGTSSVERDANPGAAWQSGFEMTHSTTQPT